MPTIADKAAREAGITTAKAGPALVKETVELLGHLELAPGAKAELRARFPGKVMSVSKAVGDRVASGVVEAYKKVGNIPVPIIVRLQGTNAEEGAKIIKESGLKVYSAILLKDAADKITEVLA